MGAIVCKLVPMGEQTVGSLSVAVAVTCVIGRLCAFTRSTNSATSFFELYFLDNHLDIASRENVCILDIGAGYGRLAHRTVTALPNVRYLCTDAVAVSTFIYME
jgi:hypothetical protein